MKHGHVTHAGRAKLRMITTTNDFSRNLTVKALAEDCVVRSPQRAEVTNKNVIKVLTVFWSHRGGLTPACAVRLTSYSTLAVFAGSAFLVISHKSTARQPAVLG